jgi:hypothetical protein
MRRKFKIRIPPRTRKISVQAKVGDTITLNFGAFNNKKAVVLKCDRRKSYGLVSINDLRGLDAWTKDNLSNKRELELPISQIRNTINRHNVFNYLLDN